MEEDSRLRKINIECNKDCDNCHEWIYHINDNKCEFVNFCNEFLGICM